MRFGLVKKFVLPIIPLAVILAACGGSSQRLISASATKTAIPKQLTGRWGREKQTMLMVVSPRGKVDWSDTFGHHAELSHVTAHRLTLSYVPGLTVSNGRSCNRTGTYRWKFTNIRGASDRLKLKKIHDACKARVHLFAGIWLTAYRLP